MYCNQAQRKVVTLHDSLGQIIKNNIYILISIWGLDNCSILLKFMKRLELNTLGLVVEMDFTVLNQTNNISLTALSVS